MTNDMDNSVDLSGLKPWFREDLERMLQSVYFTSRVAEVNLHSDADYQYRCGFLAALGSIAIMVGINPEKITRK